MYDTVQAGLINSNVESLQQIYEGLLNRVRAELQSINNSEFTLSNKSVINYHRLQIN